MRISQLRAFHLPAGGTWRSENPKVPDLADGRRPAQDEFGDVLGQECARHVARNSVYELRRNLNDERVRIAFEAVFVADSVILCLYRASGGVTGRRCGVWHAVFRRRSGLRRKPAKCRELYALLYLQGVPPILMPARQTTGLGPSGRRFSGGVTVYLAQKTTVYRQVYRHETVDLAGRSETAEYAGS